MKSEIVKVINEKYSQQPQFEHMWRIVLPSLGKESVSAIHKVSNANTGEDAMLILNKADGDLNDIEKINSRVSSIEVPFMSFETKKNTSKSGYFYTAGNNDLGTISLRIDEFEDGLSLKYFTMWQQLIKNRNGTYNLPFIYKKDIYLYKVSSSGDEIHITRYINFFPVDISPGSHNYESSNILQYSITFAGDAVEQKFIPVAKVRQMVEASQNDLIKNSQIKKHGLNLNDDVLGSVASLINKGIDIFK